MSHVQGPVRALIVPGAPENVTAAGRDPLLLFRASLGAWPGVTLETESEKQKRPFKQPCGVPSQQEGQNSSWDNQSQGCGCLCSHPGTAPAPPAGPHPVLPPWKSGGAGQGTEPGLSPPRAAPATSTGVPGSLLGRKRPPHRKLCNHRFVQADSAFISSDHLCSPSPVCFCWG